MGKVGHDCEIELCAIMRLTALWILQGNDGMITLPLTAQTFLPVNRHEKFGYLSLLLHTFF